MDPDLNVHLWTIRIHELQRRNEVLKTGAASVHVKTSSVLTGSSWHDYSEEQIARNNQWIIDLRLLMAMHAAHLKNNPNFQILIENVAEE